MSFTVIVKVVVDGVAVVGTKVEKNAGLEGWQGLPKVDWTTEWFYNRSVASIHIRLSTNLWEIIEGDRISNSSNSVDRVEFEQSTFSNSDNMISCMCSANKGHNAKNSA